MWEMFQVTAQYSNAVLVAILPYFSDFAKKLDLPVPIPLTTNHVFRFNCDPRQGEVGGRLVLSNGYQLRFHSGYVTGFEHSGSYFSLQNPNKVHLFVGKVNLDQKGAVRIARASLAKLGYSIDSIFVNPEPVVGPLEKTDGHIIPRYRVRWIEPHYGNTAIDIEVNAEAKRLERMSLTSRSFWREPPKVIGQSGNYPSSKRPHPVSSVKADVLTTVLAAVSRYAERLLLPLKAPITSNQVTTAEYGLDEDEIRLVVNDGYTFTYGQGYIHGFSEQGCFYSSPPSGPVSDYLGAWKMSEREAADLARGALVKAGYSLQTLSAQTTPEILRPFVTGKTVIPRYHVIWQTVDKGVLQSCAVVEIDADRRRVKSLSVFLPTERSAPPQNRRSAKNTPEETTPMTFKTNSPARLKPPPTRIR